MQKGTEGRRGRNEGSCEERNGGRMEGMSLESTRKGMRCEFARKGRESKRQRKEGRKALVTLKNRKNNNIVKKRNTNVKRYKIIQLIVDITLDQ